MKRTTQPQQHTGRPKLDPNDDTVRVGFTVQMKLWSWFMEQAEKRQIGYSTLFREMVEKIKNEQEKIY